MAEEVFEYTKGVIRIRK